MADYTNSPNMQLPVPIVGTASGPEWSDLLNQCLAIIDSHNHSPGSGVQVNPAGININAALPFNDFPINTAASLGLSAQGSTPSGDLRMYSDGTDVYFTDGNGNHIQLTKSGGPNAGTGNISGLPSTPSGGAGIAWANSQATFQHTKDDGTVGAHIDGGSLIVRYAGSYPTPSGTNYILLKVPSSIAAGYALTLPAAVPGSANAFLASSTGGVLSYINVDNSTLDISSALLEVKAGGVGTTQLGDSSVTTAKIAGGAVMTANISALQITTALLAANAVTGAKMANATVTGTQVATNVGFNGKQVSGNGLNFLVSNTNPPGGAGPGNGLSVIRGVINSAGAILGGEGFTVSHSVTGVYTINYTVALGDAAAVTANPFGTSIQPYIITIDTSAASCVFRVCDLSGVAQNAAISFHCIGQRA